MVKKIINLLSTKLVDSIYLFKRKLDHLKDSNKPKILFIWIPKNAGTSIYTMLNEGIDMQKLIHFKEAKESFNNVGAVTFGHISILELLDEKVLTENYLTKATIFCISRNPYDRFVSLLHYHKKHNLIPQEFTPLQFITKIENGIPPLGVYNSKELSLCNPQVFWIKGVRVDKVLSFENFSEIENFLSPYLKENYTYQHKNKSPNRSSFLDELDTESILKINKYYKEDFDYFGYEMMLC